VLLVEDNPLIQAELSNSLRSVAAVEVVHLAGTQTDACGWLEAHPEEWDLAVIDIFLRQGHGFDVLRSCASRKPWQKAVVLSNYTVEPARSSAVRLGADAVFDKCFEMEAFLEYCAAVASSPALAGAGGFRAASTPGSVRLA
jgi:DNA-binding NarL/FixJ family response regulator